MSIQLKDLIVSLQKHPQDKEVECIIVGDDGIVITLNVETATDNMIQLLQLFDK